MPKYSDVHARVCCPHCTGEVTGVASFSWGYAAGQGKWERRDGAGLVIAVPDTEADALARGDDWEPERYNLRLDTPYFPPFHAPNPHYEIGDVILWRRFGGGVAPWAFFTDGGCNIGDHNFLSLDVLDEVNFYRESLGDTFPCPSCGEAFGGVVTEIRDGILSSVRAFLPGEYDALADIYLLSPDGSRRPMVEWYDRTMITLPEKFP